MKEPRWITKGVVLAAHEEMLALFGGLDGVRDEGLLESALHRPQQLFSYGTPSIYELAASYAEGIVKNHPFLDGNKRSAFLTAYIFLEANGLVFSATEEQVVLQTLGLAASEISAAEYAVWLKDSCKKKSKKS